MPRFALIYRNANPPSTPEEGQQHMAAWMAWSNGLGAAMIEPGMPFSQSVAVSLTGTSEDIGPHQLNGISIVEADDRQAALAMAQSCPHMTMGGDIVVSEGMDMPMQD
ncbi:MAG: YciI family protein [Erythrobacter sp.]